MNGGIVWKTDPLAFRLGPVGMRYYTILLIATFVLGYFLWRRQALRGGYEPRSVKKFSIVLVIATVLGAHLGHAFFYYPSWYLSRPFEIIAFWHGGFSSHGAALAIAVACGFYARNQKVSLFDVWDRMTFPAAVGATLVRIGNFFNSEVVGRETDASWGMRFIRYDSGSVLRHPSQLYEAALGALVLASLWAADRLAGGEERPRGLLTGIFLTVYFAGRFFVEFFKEHQSLPQDSPLTLGQYLSIPGVAAGILVLVWVTRKPSSTGR